MEVTAHHYRQMSNMNRYKYQPLTYASSIRLLYISADEAKPHGMSLSLKEINLVDEPEYSAFSYTWQLPEYPPGKQHHDPGSGQNFEVECDGQSMTISENLFRFLSTAVQTLARCGQQKSDGNDVGVDQERENFPQRYNKNTRQNRATAKKVSKLVETLSKWPLWIDAFCINQSDRKERQHQVLHMDKIYNRAKNVLVWLGDAAPSEDLVWVHDVFIPTIGRIMKRESTAAGIIHLVGDPLCSSDKAAELLGETICSRWPASWLSFANFVDRRRWFDRGWIVQEVALGCADNITLLCGEVELSWRRFTALSHFLQLSGWATSLRAVYNATLHESTRSGSHLGFTKWWKNKSPVGGRIHSIHEVHRMITQYTKQGSEGDSQARWYHCASHLISTLRNSHFEDDRDHIYGCLGMLSQILPPGLANPIVPDYEKTVQEVFTSVAAMMLTNTPGLSELARVEDRRYRRHHSLPSWVPDYSVPHRGDLNVVHDGNMRQLPDSPADIDAIATSPDRTPPIIRQPIVIGSSLVVHGTCINFIEMTGLRSPWTKKTVSFDEDLLKLIRKATSLHTENMALDFWNVLARGNIDAYLQVQSSSPLPLDQQEAPPPSVPLKRMLSSVNQREWAGEIKTTVAEVQKINLHKPTLDQNQPLASNIWEVLSSAALYVTMEEGRLGIGPASCQYMDEIWMLEGSDRLFILREAGMGVDSLTETQFAGASSYRLVGETYIHGIDVQKRLQKMREWVVPIVLE